MAKLIEGIPGRNYEEDIDIWEDDAYLVGDDPDTEDINLLEDMVDYSVDESQTPARVKILLKDGNSVVIGMNKTELRTYNKSAEAIFNERPLTFQDTKKVLEQVRANYTPAQRTAWKILKVILYIWAAAVIVGILFALFGK